MRSSKHYVVVGLAALAVLGFGALDNVLRLTGKVGDVRKYKLTFDGTSTDGAIKITGDVSRKVINVDTDGALTVQESRTNMSLELNGNPIVGLPSVLDKVVNPDGTTRELRGEGASPEAYRAAVLNSVKFPDFPLAPDKTWTWDFPANARHGSVKARGEYKVVGQDRLHDIDTWKVSASVTEAGDASSSASSLGVVWISKSDGSIVKSESKITNLPLKNGPLSGTQSLDLVP